MATAPDLWGNLETEQITKTPLSILKEQAALLGKKTGNVLEARVVTTNLISGFGHQLFLVAPALDGYTYELLKFSNPIQLYPVTPDSFDVLRVSRGSFDDELIPPPSADTSTSLRDEDAFLKWLQAKLSSADTHRIIGSLLSQSR